MKFIVVTVLIALLSFVACLYLPWWSIALVAFAVSLMIRQKPLASFAAGFLGLLLLWVLVAAIINAQNDGVLAARVAEIFPLGGSAFMLIAITGLVGALVGGMAALVASYTRK
jgi:hypothetical protein